jgi:CAAX protease family protein
VHSNSKRDVIADVVQFCVVTVALSALFAVLIIRAGHITSGRSLFTRGLMWSPGVAALVLLRRRGNSWREIGWQWTGRWEWICYGAALVAGAAVYGLTWAAGVAGFPNHTAVDSIASDFGWRQLPTTVVVGGYAALTLTLGMVPAVTSALGEEIGWRGYLVPRLSKAYGFTATAMISGGIWAAWHYPMFAITDYYRGGRLWFSLACFTVLVLAASTICAWLRLKSGSIWPAVMLHGSTNLFVDDVLRPLSVNNARSSYALGQFGGLLPLLAIVVAVAVWRRRAEVEGLSLSVGGNEGIVEPAPAHARAS